MIIASQYLLVLGSIKFVVESTIQIQHDNDLMYLSVAKTSAVLYTFYGLMMFFISLSNLKQLSYFSRIFLMLTFVVIIYVGTYCFLMIFYENPLALHVKKSETLFTSEYYNMDFFPLFFELLCQDSYMYEGIAMVPALYSNARDQ